MMTESEKDRMNTASYNDPKTGRFAPGNPGKPKGARTKFSQATLQEIVNLKDDAVQVLKNRLAANDGDAARWILERIVGRNARFVEISGVSPGEIAQDVTDGALTVDEAKDLSLAVSRLTQVEKVEELERQFEELKRLIKEGSVEL